MGKYKAEHAWKRSVVALCCTNNFGVHICMSSTILPFTEVYAGSSAVIEIKKWDLKLE